MNFEQLFRDYWWLIFPVGWGIMGIFSMVSEHYRRSETLRILKSYADQGKEPPQFLIDALKTQEERAADQAYAYQDHASGSPRYRHRHRHGGWGGVVVFAALAVGFGYMGYHVSGDATPIFTALGLAFGVAAASLLVLKIFSVLFGPKPGPKNDHIDD